MFLKPQITFDTFISVDTNNGGYLFPSDLIGKDLLDRIQDEDAILSPDEQKELLQYTCGFTFFSAEVRTGYFSRLSASGYMDCTDWNGPYPDLYTCVWDLFNNYYDESDTQAWVEFLEDCASELTQEQFQTIHDAFIGEDV